MTPQRLLALALAALPLAAAAQETPDGQARRLLEDGRAHIDNDGPASRRTGP